MKDNKINMTIAILALVAAVLMVIALSFAIGKWSFGNHRYHLLIRFPSASGINANSAVKYAGANVGRVTEIRVIPRSEQTQDPNTHLYNAVEVVAEINDNIEVGEDANATIRQDGLGISAMYIQITPGFDHNSKLLVDGASVQGHMPYDLSSLIQPAGEALSKANALLSNMQPVIARIDSFSQKIDSQLPPILTHADKFLTDGDEVLANLNTPETKDRINNMLASLRVASENLKVVSSNAKAFTATIADKPWRVFWGGPTIKPPTESEVLKSNNVLPLTPDVDVNGPTKKTNSSAPPAKPAPQIN